MDKQQKAYCRAVRRALRCPARERKALLDRLAADMAGQFGPQASPTRRELVEAFGPPETLAAEYMESMDAAVLARYEQSRLRRGRILLAGMAAALLLTVGILLARMYITHTGILPVVEVKTTTISLGECPDDMTEEEFRAWVEKRMQESAEFREDGQ